MHKLNTKSEIHCSEFINIPVSASDSNTLLYVIRSQNRFDTTSWLPESIGPYLYSSSKEQTEITDLSMEGTDPIDVFRAGQAAQFYFRSIHHSSCIYCKLCPKVDLRPNTNLLRLSPTRVHTQSACVFVFLPFLFIKKI